MGVNSEGSDDLVLGLLSKWLQPHFHEGKTNYEITPREGTRALAKLSVTQVNDKDLVIHQINCSSKNIGDNWVCSYDLSDIPRGINRGREKRENRQAERGGRGL